MTRRILFVFLFFSISGSSLAGSPGSDITQIEWNAWPDYCKAAFVVSAWAKHTPLSRSRSRSWATDFRKDHYIVNGIRGAHHFCLGMTYVNRVRSASKTERDYLLLEAQALITYSFGSMDGTEPMYSTVTAYLGKTYYLSNNRLKAISIWKEGIKAKPSRPESYLAYAEALYDEEKYGESLQLLRQFNQNQSIPNPEVEYFLGHIYLKLDDLEQAKLHADNAYNLGYQLPGLRDKIEHLENRNSQPR